MPKNLNTNIWTVDSDGYTQSTRSLFTSTPPVYTHADHIDTSFNFCVNGVNEQKKRAVLHMTNRSDVTYTTENVDNIFIGDWIYDNQGNNPQRIGRVFGNGTGGVSNFAIAPNSGSQPSGGNFKILCNFNYLTAVWAPRIGFAAKTALNSVTYYNLNDLDGESTAGDAQEGETWWAYYTRKSADYFVSIDCYNEQTYIVAGGFSSTSIYEGQIRAGLPLFARVSWLKQPYYWGYSYGTDGCLIYTDNGQGRYADLTFDVIFSYSLEYMEKKDEYDDVWKDSYSNPYDRHNILYGLKISKDIILHIICSYGLPFSFSSATNITIGNADYALPEVKNNTTTGNYFRGADAITADTDNNRWANTKDIDNKPAGGGGGGDDDDNDDPLSSVGAPFGTGLAHYYISTVDGAALTQISEAMSTWDIDATKKDLYRNLISCKIVKPPTAVPATPGVFEIYGVKPQYNGADITINEVTGNPDISFGPYDIPRKFNDFRDRAPYSKAEIFLPYCGWCGLPSHVIGRSVSVAYYSDIIAGTVKAVVFCGTNPVAEASGIMSVDIPFAAQNVGEKVAAANIGMLAYGRAAIQTAAGIGTAVASKGKSGWGNILSGGTAVTSAYNQLAQVENGNYTEICGKSGDGCALAGVDTIVIKITRPLYGGNTEAPYVPAGFAHTVGFVSMKQSKVNACTGLIVCDNVEVSGISGATDAERAEIRRVLETGLYVNSPPE